MASIKDWMTDVAKIIADYVTTTEVPIANVAGVRALIAKHSPFKDDVTYMPVPRCDSCTWWRGHHCHRLVDSSGLRHGSKAVALEDNLGGRFALLLTDANFGCVQWEK